MTISQETRTDCASLQIEVVRTIHDIEPDVWDSVGARQGLYWTHRFFSCVESSSIADATAYWYLLFYNEKQLVATAVLSRFVVALDLLLPPGVRRISDAVRRFRPSFLRLPMLFCGVPVSIGKHTLAISRSTNRETVVRELNRTMERIARDEGIGYLCFKEFVDRDLPALQILEQYGYMKARSIPRVKLEIRWPTFDEYLASMRHGYRRQVRQSLKTMGLTPAELSNPGGIGRKTHYPRMIITKLNRDNARRAHELYLQVMQRATTKLETLPRDFFEALARNMDNDLVLLGIEHNSEMLATAILGINGAELNFLLAGLDYSHRDQFQTYFNLLNGIIAFGIEKGFKTIDLGQTTYDIKQRLGGRAEPVHFYLRALSSPRNRLLRLLNRLLFPETKLPVRRVFHDSGD
jgi:predicted N-acyltransferase